MVEFRDEKKGGVLQHVPACPGCLDGSGCCPPFVVVVGPCSVWVLRMTSTLSDATLVTSGDPSSGRPGCSPGRGGGWWCGLAGRWVLEVLSSGILPRYFSAVYTLDVVDTPG